MQETRKLSVESTAGLMTGSRGSGQLLMNITSHMNICEKKVKVYVYIFSNCRQNDAIKIKSKKKVELHISRLNT